ncbi:polysaccharide pyruvyl transferase family protein [Rhizobium sp. TRM95111]|uniref:polysaccharide pyruvyl transferase family protein n=1 Tax=Rhizobium alarense TaxID=2846851 RepID=UPI001F19AD23|nr:polysaccharide pyruvyl transferase family protein [Rhizobium alarense]MCF3640234.1 polysaccharide pyruvyl transferase family protein [Rhizobium alarense]
MATQYRKDSDAAMMRRIYNFLRAILPIRKAGDLINLENISEQINDYKEFKPSNFKINTPPICTNLFLNAIDTSNVGDINSTPFDYFTFPGESQTADFWSRVNASEDRFDNIFVGGGVFSKNYVRTPMYYERLRPKKNLVLWGVGTDMPGYPPMPKDFIDRCSLIGTRDFGAASLDGDKVVFCPCASAMNRAFDVSRQSPIHEFVLFLHHNRSVDDDDFFKHRPTMRNYGDFTETIDFIASGEVVVTNSYHGLYWATLLGKKVICLIKGGKFAYFKWKPAFATPETCRQILARAHDISAYPNALAEARALNMNFYEKVLAILRS